MEIKIKGSLKGGKVVIFGKQFGWLRRITMFRYGGMDFGLSVALPPAGFSERIKLPGPVDAIVSASLVGGRVKVVFDVVTDALGLVVQSFEFNDDLGGKPQRFSLKALGAEVSGTIELV